MYSFHERPGDYFAFLGRISPEKRVDRAIEIAQAAGVPLRIAAKVDRVDEAYFQRAIEPLLDHPLVEYVGEIGESQKDEFLGNARALLFPIDWPEPFGLVMIEALACGTPVIAWRCGSVPEVIEHGVTGFVVERHGAGRRRGAAHRRDPTAACAATVFEQRFTARRMAERYLELYAALDAARFQQGDANTVESPAMP